jgi:hypothetical protein
VRTHRIGPARVRGLILRVPTATPIFPKEVQGGPTAGPTGGLAKNDVGC